MGEQVRTLSDIIADICLMGEALERGDEIGWRQGWEAWRRVKRDLA
jgi:hypothetical protein